jgi:hypothetical protein
MTICPSMYTIMIQNLPKKVNKTDLKMWIVDNLKCNPISINIAYNIKDLVNAID